MDYYGNNDWRDYLAHHGILGMKWGRRNGPPYPLGASDHSASEKKAGWRKSLGGGSSTTIRKKARYVTKESKKVNKYYNKEIKKSEKAASKAEKKYNKATEKGSSRSDKLKELYLDKLADSEASKRIKEKELERIRDMSLKDIKDEKARTKEQKKMLKGRLSDSDEFYQKIKKSRENKKELQRLKSERRVTQGERNQIKEQAREKKLSPSQKRDAYEMAIRNDNGDIDYKKFLDNSNFEFIMLDKEAKERIKASINSMNEEYRRNGKNEKYRKMKMNNR